MQKTLLTIIGLLLASSLMSQGILDQYIDEGIKNNINLKQASLEFEASLESLNEAKGAMLPKIDFSSRYTKANGGRNFEFPVGDLMNPVYSSLNGIIGEEQFPQIENLSLNFNRTTDIDNKLTLTQPLFDKRITYQKNIAEDQAKISQVDVSIQKRLLISQIKKAYFNYLKSVKLVELFDSTRSLVEENLRVSEVLHQNDKVTLDVTLRAQTEIGKVNLQIAEAQKMKNNSRAYFNFLLNKPLESAIKTEDETDDPTLPAALPESTKERRVF